MSASAVRRSESTFVGAGGRSLFRRAWIAAEPNRVLLVVHGFAEHSGRYEAFGTWFAARGGAVHAFDLRGHGRSGGQRGHVRTFSEFLDDLDAFLETVRAAHPDLPFNLVGHSLGGLILVEYLRQRRPEIAGAVTSGAAFRVADGVGSGRRATARLLRRLLPRLPMSSGIEPAALSRDPDVVRRYVEDPLVFRRISASLASELFAAAERNATAGDAVGVPMLVLHGGDDPLCSAEGSQAFFEGLQDEGSALRIYPERRHEIFTEPEAEMVFQDVLDWLDALDG